MGINLQSLSITSAFKSIVSFFRSQENNGKWKDLTTGSEGSFLIRLLANIFSTLSYRIVAQSRENYLSTAALPSSNIGISVNLGYSAFRGSNLKRKVRLNPTGNFTLPKLSVIGSYDTDHDIFVLNETTLVEGEPIDIDTVVGKVKEETFTAGTSAVKCFSLFTTGISEDYVLYLDSNEVPTTKVIKQMTEDKYLVRTNPYSSVDIMYLNTLTGAKYAYGTGSEITIRYVELEDVRVVPYIDSMFVNYGTLLDTSNISLYLPFESVDQMKINAPLDHETQNLIRSKQDYANRLRQIIPSVIDANYKPLTPTYTLIAGLKSDFTLLTEAEIEEVKGLLKQENYFGTPLPDITHPRREVANLLIQLALTNKYKNISDIDLDINNILENFYDAKLGDTFSTFDLERKIESLSYVKYARVNHVVNERKPNTNYQVGYILEHEGKSYIASKILGYSGISTPNWNIPVGVPSSEIDLGLETQDGGLIWRTFKRLPEVPSTSLFVRENIKQYAIGDYVYDDLNAPGYMFKCVDLIKSSGFTEPNLIASQLGDFIVDKNIVWVVKDRGDYPMWSSTTNYRLGQSVNTYSGPEVSLECISYTGTVGTEENIDFELPVYNINEQTSNTFSVSGNKTFYFRPNDVILATYPSGSKTFVVVSSIFKEGNTIIYVQGSIDDNILYEQIEAVERGTKDGQILWTLIDDVNNITYPWNGYVVFDHQLEIIQ